MDKKLSLQGPLFIFSIVVILALSASLLYVLKSENRLLVSKMNASGLELQKLQSQSQKEKIIQEKPSSSLVPSSQVAVIADMFSVTQNKTWEKLTTDNGNISMSYPKNLFQEPKKYGDSDTGFRLHVLTQETWKKDAGEKLDGVSDELGDPDDYDFNWDKRFATYNEVLKNKTQIYHFGFESSAIAQKVKVINNIPFIVGIVGGVNGSCQIEYVTFQKNTEIKFSVDICDDPMFSQYSYSHFKDKKVIALAQNILDQNEINFGTEMKMNALERVINTITVKD